VLLEAYCRLPNKGEEKEKYRDYRQEVNERRHPSPLGGNGIGKQQHVYHEKVLTADFNYAKISTLSHKYNNL